VDRAFEEMTARYERYCLAAGLEALGAMMEADAPAQIPVGEVAAVRQIGGEQVLERCAPDSAGHILAEQVLDLGRVDAGRLAGIGGVAVEAACQRLAPLRAPRPGDQAVELVRGSQGCRVLAEGPWAPAWTRRGLASKRGWTP
jgi:hypothetical protein